MNKIEFDLMKKCGIYSIKNVINNKEYIGSSRNLYNRLHEHFHNLKNNKSHNSHLQNAWNKYGENNFKFEILEYCDVLKQFELEQYYLDIRKPKYNFEAKVVPFTGRIVPIEQRLKISKTLKKKYANGEIFSKGNLKNSKKCYIYNINTFELVNEFSTLAESFLFLKEYKSKKGYKEAMKYIYNKKYIISVIYFESIIELKNYIYKNYYKIHSKEIKYLITEDLNGNIIYHKNRKSCIDFNNITLSIMESNSKACIESPYISKNNNKIYYSEIFYPINKPF